MSSTSATRSSLQLCTWTLFASLFCTPFAIASSGPPATAPVKPGAIQVKPPIGSSQTPSPSPPPAPGKLKSVTVNPAALSAGNTADIVLKAEGNVSGCGAQLEVVRCNSSVLAPFAVSFGGLLEKLHPFHFKGYGYYKIKATATGSCTGSASLDLDVTMNPGGAPEPRPPGCTGNALPNNPSVTKATFEQSPVMKLAQAKLKIEGTGLNADCLGSIEWGDGTMFNNYLGINTEWKTIHKQYANPGTYTAKVTPKGGCSASGPISAVIVVQ
ncbi:MAG: hypothetical protein JNM76_02515 [Betaproteobacteria bacterium]|nr:hypothetical protein [Betaproteobacteria bacterium]